MKKRHSRILLSGSFLALFLMAGQVQAATFGFFSVDGSVDSTFDSPCFTTDCSVPTTIRAEGVFDFELISLVEDSFINLFDVGHSLDIFLGDTIFSTSDIDNSFFFDDPVMSFVDGSFFGFESFFVEQEIGDNFDVVADLFSSDLSFSATSYGFDEFGSFILGDIAGTWDASSFSPDFRNNPSVIPVPAAVWLFGTALLGMAGFSKRKKVRT